MGYPPVTLAFQHTSSRGIHARASLLVYLPSAFVGNPYDSHTLAGQLDHGMRHCWLRGQAGRALRAVLCAVLTTSTGCCALLPA